MSNIGILLQRHGRFRPDVEAIVLARALLHLAAQPASANWLAMRCAGWASARTTRWPRSWATAWR